MRVHLVDGTYELFRHFFGQPPRAAENGSEVGAARGVVLSLVTLLREGASHVGVATDHVIESFRNDLWPTYKDGSGIAPELKSQFGLLEDALVALGVLVWPMTELEADDALASGAAVATDDPRVDQVLICTPDKDLAQCVDGVRVVQLDRRKEVVTDEAGVWEKFGVAPRSIPDWLGLVGDSADGFPGLPGWGKRSASVVLAHYGSIDEVPDSGSDWEPGVRAALRGTDKLAATLASQRAKAELFRNLATLRVDRTLLGSVDQLAWNGPTPAFPQICERFRDPGLAERVSKLAAART